MFYGKAGEIATENSYPDLRSIEALVVFVQVIILESRDAVQSKDRISSIMIINALVSIDWWSVSGTGQRVYGYCIIFPFIFSKNDAL